MSKCYLAFNKEWFKRNQKKLLWLLNCPFTKRWSRWILRIYRDCPNQKIIRIEPNSYTVLLRKTKRRIYLRSDFRTHWKFSKRIYFAFKYVWWMMHFWDWFLAERFLPKLSFGFPTLTQFPDPGSPGTTTVDGWVGATGLADTYTNVRNAAGNSFADTTNNNNLLLGRVDATATTDQYSAITRGIYLFDTSSIGGSSSINTGTISWSGTGTATTDNFTETLHVVASGPASNTSLANGDYTLPGNWGTTSFASLAYTSFTTTNNVYNDFTLNASGRNNISKTGVSKFGTRMSDDLNNTTPVWVSNGQSIISTYSADNPGTSSDPKLVVDYSLGGTIPNLLLLNIG